MAYERLTSAKRRRFLRALARGLNNRDAAAHAGVSRRQTLYELAARSPRFADAWDRAWAAGQAHLKAAEQARHDAFMAELAKEQAKREERRRRLDAELARRMMARSRPDTKARQGCG